MSKNVTVTIDNLKVTVPAGVTIWGAARKLGINIPTLCHHFDVKPYSGCRVCLVEVKGGRALAAACSFPVSDGLEIYTNSPKVREARRLVVELLLANHPHDCLTCDRNQTCELQKIALDLGVKEIRFDKSKPTWEIDRSSPSLVRDPNKCILCGRCVRVCNDKQTCSVYTFANRGFNSIVTPAFGKGLGEVACTLCGQCSVICPVGAITVKEDIEPVLAAIDDPDKIVVVQTAPSVRVALGEAFGGAPGSIVTGKMVAGLKRAGFDRVLDTNFTADVTIMEEATEFLHRLENPDNHKLPMITSCSPGWINFMEMFYPELVEHHSTCKSPQQIFGALAKTFYAEREKLDPSKIVSVSIMPCTAKKFECTRPEMDASGYKDVDYVLTTRELAKLFKGLGISFDELKPEEYDPVMGIGSGAGTIFGNTGGVMEAALRTAYEVVTKKTLPAVEFAAIRGLGGLREAVIDLDGTKIKVAIAHGLGNARKVMEAIKAGNPNGWHFIEVMACPGGCISGGGQPISTDINYRAKRIAGLYEDDRQLPLRKSHENPEVKALYDEYLKEPGGHLSHKLLHTTFHNAHKDLFTV
ncbi:MAG: [FeFe] hydrogenase, group A [Deltaproteobacteria bacterium]|jgi:NADH-quinone oxidoreductase subunit G/NADP-reducing hydrogenase subunit HndD|nr:[FeFe] hydrogenase, group A [Deltaproteobacteria bacterium]